MRRVTIVERLAKVLSQKSVDKVHDKVDEIEWFYKKQWIEVSVNTFQHPAKLVEYSWSFSFTNDEFDLFNLVLDIKWLRISERKIIDPGNWIYAKHVYIEYNPIINYEDI